MLAQRERMLKCTCVGSPHYFKTCKISAVALIKMVRGWSSWAGDKAEGLCLQVIHARSGVPHEIMGMMQGKVVGTSLVIVDSFALPVQGTETRVNAANEANEYMVQYVESSNRVRTWSYIAFAPPDASYHAFRYLGSNMLSGGTTHILATDVGCPVST